MDFQKVLSDPLFSVASTQVSVGEALAVVATLIVAFLLAWAARRLTTRHFERHDVKDDVSIRTSSNAIAIIVFAVGVEIALTILGIHLTSLFAAGGIFALGAGFAAKDIVQNFLSGIILRMDRTISPGDMVQVEDQWFEIEIIGVRATVGRTLEDEQILIPNSTLAQSTVRNLTREDNLVMIKTTIPVDPTSDAELVERVLREAVESLDWVSSNAEPVVFLYEFTRYSINFLVGVWIEDSSISVHSRSKLNLALWSALSKAGVTLV